MRCTCGTELPPDARFCFRCGKPQRDEDVAILDVAAPSPEPVASRGPEPLPSPLLEISLRNAVAVRIALLVGTLAFLVTALLGEMAMSQVLYFALMGLAGAFSVFLYRRRTGLALTAVNGARLGWITGFFGFLIAAVLFTVLAVALMDPNVVAAVREQAKVHNLPEANVKQVLEMFRNPAQVLSSLAVTFVLFTLIPAFGGAVGARMMRPSQR